ncbi:hypothetical protein [Streptomyces roseifaciens]|uniref:hypothetical protein n=1 Tax=Streptomyces roseifaciens TaxID=1488406 RepID=UPI000A6F2A84|nr:hypothetical protein [Streptomyces roseifaciens]
MRDSGDDSDAEIQMKVGWVNRQKVVWAKIVGASVGDGVSLRWSDNNGSSYWRCGRPADKGYATITSGGDPAGTGHGHDPGLGLGLGSTVTVVRPAVVAVGAREHRPRHQALPMRQADLPPAPPRPVEGSEPRRRVLRAQPVGGGTTVWYRGWSNAAEAWSHGYVPGAHLNIRSHPKPGVPVC